MKARCLFLIASIAFAAEPGRTPEGYALPQPGRAFVFPRDHGSHPEFKIEWWYLTGHLFAEDGRRFGWQATFFRRGGKTPQDEQVFLAHLALLDVKTGRFLHQERLHRDGLDARSSTDTLAVQCGPWSLQMNDDERLQVSGTIRGAASFDLALTPRKPLVVFGDTGVSRKGAHPHAASHYLTFPRLDAAGTLTLGTDRFAVRGEAWMDHEISSSQLDDGQVGWDWAAIQLRDGREAMVYRMRRADGAPDPHSTLAFIDAAGRVTHTQDFTLEVPATWRSPHTGAEYPAGLVLAAPGLRWRLEPLARDQELTGRITGLAYWEGACRVLDERGSEIGSAFVELTGYHGDLRQSLR